MTFQFYVEMMYCILDNVHLGRNTKNSFMALCYRKINSKFIEDETPNSFRMSNIKL